jgi:hypothetical protein
MAASVQSQRGGSRPPSRCWPWALYWPSQLDFGKSRSFIPLPVRGLGRRHRAVLACYGAVKAGAARVVCGAKFQF